MIAESVEKNLRASPPLDQPHTCEFQATHGGDGPGAADVDLATQYAARFVDSVAPGVVVGGGIDLIRDFAEVVPAKYPFAHVSDYPKLRDRFDDMHHVMFGQSSTFDRVSDADASEAFVTVDRRAVHGQSYTVAIARTPAPGSRAFAKVLPALLVR
jgi:hypothetical protein